MKRLYVVLAAIALVACSPKSESPKIEKTSYACKVTVDENITSAGTLNYRTNRTYERYYSLHVTFSPYLNLDPTQDFEKQPRPGLLAKDEKYRYRHFMQLTHKVVFDDLTFEPTNIDNGDHKNRTVVYINHEAVRVDRSLIDNHGKQSINHSTEIRFDPITKVFSHSSHYDKTSTNSGYLETIKSSGLCEIVKQ